MKIQNKKAAMGSLLTWILAFLIIFFVMFIFDAIALNIAKTRASTALTPFTKSSINLQGMQADDLAITQELAGMLATTIGQGNQTTWYELIEDGTGGIEVLDISEDVIIKTIDSILNNSCKDYFLKIPDGNFYKEPGKSFEKISFDNAILEKLDPINGLVLSVDIGWSDVGAWEALKEALASSPEENVTKGNVELVDSKDTLAFNYNDQLVVGIDLEGMLVINTGDVLLVCPKTSVPKIKKYVESLAGAPNEKLA